MHITKQVVISTSLGLLATSILWACGAGSTTTSTPGITINGVVTATYLTPGSTMDPNIAPAYYQNAKVCVDANSNGVCEASESPVLTGSDGSFSMAVPAAAALIADIGTTATNSASGKAVASRDVLRASLAQVMEQTGGVVISPLSSEVARLMEANVSSNDTEKQNVAIRLGVSLENVLADVNKVIGSDQKAMLAESRALDARFTYAITKLDRGDLYPDDLAVPGGDPRLKGAANVTQATAPSATDTRSKITFAQSQQAAFNIEGIPRYDHVFVVMLENKGTNQIVNSAYAPKINALLAANNQLTSYFSTGNPSEPNYTALGGADDFGITDDSQWNCDASGANAVQDLPVPDKTQPGLASSPFAATCTQASRVSHNIVGKPNLFNALSANGMAWRTYSESMNPGQDFRTDSVSDTSVFAPDHVYPVNTVGSNSTPLGNANLQLPLPSGLYKTKHHPGMAYQNVRSAPEWKYSNRTMGGGQWDAVLLGSKKYAAPANYDLDQLGTDLTSGNVGALNFVVPDQCDDMHGITVTGVLNGVTTTASDCSGNPLITRGDNYVSALVQKIQASGLWKNSQKRVAIVLMFDEGSATAGFNSCCGGNPGNSTVSNPLKQNADGSYSVDTSITGYTRGNRGHGESIFGILTNQAAAPKGIVDSDAYSHFSLVRTFQDMFGLADPQAEGSYMNRSKYTEHFIAANILNLPEYAGSADTHFQAVRPINHAWVAPATYVQKQSSDATGTAQVGPDENQVNVWALK
jgi:Phosphoesterase family